MNAVELRGVSKIFSLNGGDIRPIDNLTLSLEAGKITVLMGRSGCGKSTLTYCRATYPQRRHLELRRCP